MLEQLKLRKLSSYDCEDIPDFGNYFRFISLTSSSKAQQIKEKNSKIIRTKNIYIYYPGMFWDYSGL